MRLAGLDTSCCCVIGMASFLGALGRSIAMLCPNIARSFCTVMPQREGKFCSDDSEKESADAQSPCCVDFWSCMDLPSDQDHMEGMVLAAVTEACSFTDADLLCSALRREEDIGSADHELFLLSPSSFTESAIEKRNGELSVRDHQCEIFIEDEDGAGKRISG